MAARGACIKNGTVGCWEEDNSTDPPQDYFSRFFFRDLFFRDFFEDFSRQDFARWGGSVLFSSSQEHRPCEVLKKSWVKKFIVSELMQKPRDSIENLKIYIEKLRNRNRMFLLKLEEYYIKNIFNFSMIT